MSLKWPNKDPDEVLDYSIDWSRFLGTATINSVTWFVHDSDDVKTQLVASGSLVNGVQLVSATNTNTVATAIIGSGTNNLLYKFVCRITTSDSLTVERSIHLRIREK
tara:strand:- start:55 stop:375 length:321 start_codon:yes stop_codon:yes gene_type:complete